MANDKPQNEYGYEDQSYQAAGRIEGIHQLVDDFYTIMSQADFAAKIFAMHPIDDIETSKDKLSCFLSGWLGGPKLYREKYGAIAIPKFHAHMDIGTPERDAWLHCMQLALEKQDYSPDFKHYLLTQLFVPAERSRLAAERAKSSDKT